MKIVFKSFNFSIATPFIVFINTFVFFLWKISSESPNGFMSKNFTVSWYSVFLESRFWTLISSAFSHNMFFHFFINMYVLWGFGRVVERFIGIRTFFRFYILAGAVSSLSHCLISYYLVQSPGLPALGASGSIAGIILLFSLLFPKEKILLLGIIPLPAIFGALLFVGLDIWGLLNQVKGHGLPIGHGAHLGGAFFGLLYYYWSIRPHLNTTKNQRTDADQVIDVDYERLS